MLGVELGNPADYVNMLEAGADKCSTNTAAIHNPDLINEASKIIWPSQACVIGIDAKRRYVEDRKETQDKIIVETEQKVTAGTIAVSMVDGNLQVLMH